MKGEVHMVQDIPVWEKLNLSFEEAAAYSGIGINKLRSLANDPRCSFVIRIGNKKLIKRKKFEEYLSSTFEL